MAEEQPSARYTMKPEAVGCPRHRSATIRHAAALDAQI
jgi:hypothetical protein